MSGRGYPLGKRVCCSVAPCRATGVCARPPPG